MLPKWYFTALYHCSFIGNGFNFPAQSAVQWVFSVLMILSSSSSGSCCVDVWAGWSRGIRAHGQPSVQFSEVCQEQGTLTMKSVVNTVEGLFLYLNVPLLYVYGWFVLHLSGNQCMYFSGRYLDQLYSCLESVLCPPPNHWKIIYFVFHGSFSIHLDYSSRHL